MSSFVKQEYIIAGYSSARTYGQSVESKGTDNFQQELKEMNLEAKAAGWPHYGGDRIFIWCDGEQVAMIPVSKLNMLSDMLQCFAIGTVIELRRGGISTTSDSWQLVDGFFKKALIHMGSWDEDHAKQEEEVA